MAFTGVFFNFLFAMLVLGTGVIGIIITRLLKGSWNSAKWTWIPIFWVPFITSWPVSLSILYGGFDE